jgi:hypothetical protein
MQRRSFSFSPRHDKILTVMAAKLDVSMVETVQRALETLEEKEAARDKDIKP